MRLSGRHPVAGILVGCAVIATSCSGSGDDAKDQPQPQAPPGSSASTKPSPTRPPGLAPELYRRKLTATGKPISEALAAIRNARTPTALSAHLRGAERLVGQTITNLNSVLPPDRVEAQHTDYVSALRTLDADITELQGAVSGKDLCAASSVMSKFGGLRSVKVVPAAARALRLKGFPTALSMPATPPMQTRRLGTGTFTRDGARSGLGQLQIQNNGSTDAVVSLVTGKVPAFAVYVRGGANYTVTGVNDGTYFAYFTTGKDWDSASNGFTRSCNFTKYDQSFPFATTATTRPGWQITLEEVINGNASTTDIDPKDYPGG